MHKITKMCLSSGVILTMASSFAFGMENEEGEGQPAKHPITMSRSTDPKVAADVQELKQRLSHVEEKLKQLEVISKESEETKRGGSELTKRLSSIECTVSSILDRLEKLDPPPRPLSPWKPEDH
ncbi:MAG: hypothetical protein ACD_16C00201G0001 [uncultured bacterium]|nr:MAG: hypothetical protein ACD_16C00201G0001 [uncultured bacterium]OFW74505.1 MAG: hypothetical protein A2Z80_02100 [Alphaproteobacteria bacterium GWA2_41_27]OFW84683.1 MAG: hypothetical protein A3E50_05870 [Alphaproteobacteria bacterium RIFCSPHIGHO2_12_FULL_42_100]OFW86306.1 MAG: hypothetical protein A2W06_04845 [Alphaproteobacteria bacterium RBG_16_42_14]OFW91501.1 MAG: hypothetical protein A2W46_00095 [Alphaproteobacteria bacterium RIFCSPHIGHO2_12_42_13]OFW92795.1 MAG: hypothetical protei